MMYYIEICMMYYIVICMMHYIYRGTYYLVIGKKIIAPHPIIGQRRMSVIYFLFNDQFSHPL